MKRFFWNKIAFLVLGAVLFSACSLELRPTGDESIEYIVVSESSKSESSYAAENPKADEDIDFGIKSESPQQAASESKSSESETPEEKTEKENETDNTFEEVKAVWISFLDFETILTGKSEVEFTTSISAAFDNIEQMGLNTVFVQVRPFADAIYKSEYFPWSYIATGTEGVAPGYDPLEIMVAEARKRNLKIEAWLNPYRVRSAGSDKALSAGNTAGIWLAEGNSAVKQYGGVISYNPADPAAQELIVNGAREIIRNYDVDGIHIDDYFYPHTDPEFDSSEYKAYRDLGGELSLADWRRENVLTLVKKLYSAIKEERAAAVFGISPQSSIENNYNSQYLDVEEITSKPGYCDYICPQVYFGFENDIQPFGRTMSVWSEMIKTDDIKLYAGLAVYKTGLTDSYAGSGKAEWQENDNLMQRMIEYSRELEYYSGFALYRYDSIFNPADRVQAHVDREMRNLDSIIK